MPVARHVQGDRPADAEVRPQHRPFDARGDRAVHAEAQCHVMRNARERGMTIALEHERRERRRRLDVACARARVPARIRSRRCRSSEASVHRSPEQRCARRSETRRQFQRQSLVPHAQLRSRAVPSRSPRPGDPLRQAARRARFAIDWYPGTACRPPPRAAARRALRRTPPRDRPETRAARSGQSRDEPPQKSRSVTTRLVTLHRDPPLTRIFAPIFVAPSKHRTSRSGAARFAKIAVASPAAPAPMMIAVIGVVVGGWWLVDVHSSRFTVHIGNWELGFGR